MAKLSQQGVCKLTGWEGQFVRAHIFPAALTRPAISGASLIQAGEGTRPVRRWSSWYDRALVTREGENILAEYDDWAIAELRRTRLVWSGWGPMTQLQTPDHKRIGGTEYGLRVIRDVDPMRLRLFFLSLLWRAAETALPEFANVKLSDGELSELRRMVRQQDPHPLEAFPVALMQLSTLGVVHNHTILEETKYLDFENSEPEISIPFYRIYFDGLIAHLHKPNPEGDHPSQFGNQILGMDDHFVVPTVSFEGSFQRENLLRLIAENG